MHLMDDIRAFAEGRQREHLQARQTAALFLACGVDLEEALRAPADIRARIVVRIERLIERERLRGMRRHWSYDLNRHIALKQALDRIRTEPTADPVTAAQSPVVV